MSALEETESIIRKAFRDEPFHNLYFKYGVRPSSSSYGGTCSDKVLSVYRALKEAGIKSSLYSSFINNKETHRLLQIELDGEYFFSDVGNAWPSLHLFPSSRAHIYENFGIQFSSVHQGDWLNIYQTRNGRETLSISIPSISKSEDDIIRDIQDRFSDDIDYPFRHGIRFAQVVDDEFLFLRDSDLHIHSQSGSYRKIDGIKESELEETLHKYFNFNHSEFIEHAAKPV